LLGRNFKRINDKNANIVVTSDAEIFFERKILDVHTPVITDEAIFPVPINPSLMIKSRI